VISGESRSLTDTSRKRHPGGGPGQAATSTIFAGKRSDADGRKVDELESLYVDIVTDLPSFGTVKAGMPTRHRLVFVLLDQATVGPRVTSRSPTIRSK
jgi:hypothetical protein